MKLARRFAFLPVVPIGALTCGVMWLGCSDVGGSAVPTASAEDAAARDDSGQQSDAPEASTPRDAALDRGPGSSEAPVTPACTQYCTQLMDTCKGRNLQFQTIGACFRSCQYYPPGDLGDATGDSLICRAYHARTATAGPAEEDGHCLHAGPYGYSGCGEPCEALCEIAMGWCAGSSGGAPFASNAACQAECALFLNAPGPGPVGVAYSANGPATGNSIDCREYHLTKSLESFADRDVECPLVKTASAACKD